MSAEKFTSCVLAFFRTSLNGLFKAVFPLTDVPSLFYHLFGEDPSPCEFAIRAGTQIFVSLVPEDLIDAIAGVVVLTVMFL